MQNDPILEEEEVSSILKHSWLQKGHQKDPGDAVRDLQEGLGQNYCAGGEEHKVQHAQAAADPSWAIPIPLVLVILEVGAHQPRRRSLPSAGPAQAIPGHYLLS